jgi:hypothetical protein
MKTSLFIFCCTTIILASCQKSNIDNTVFTQNPYLNTKSGSTWNYHEINSSSGTPVNSDYTITSSSKDTTINSKSYHVYNYSYGGSQYLNITGHSYYQFDSIPGGLGQIFEQLYLKDDALVGVSWKQDLSITLPGIPISVPFTVTNTIVEKGISRIVNGINYTNVIHVSVAISSSLIPSASLTSAINSYYSPNYGLIENTSQVQLNYPGVSQTVNIETKLTSANLK